MAGWPVAADYDEAIQNPHLNFDDKELKEGEPEYDPYGSPAVRSGNFASVYMLQCPKRKVAVRCFLREIPDQQERYQAISRDLLGLGLPYTVDFEFLPKGIKIQGDWFPILKMDWCEGEQLDRYLERNLDQQAKLRRMADKWFEMSVALRKVGIAHGDLSHGNIMVQGDELKLIDYDGMFVPRLAGRRSNERGLEHYQHPGRTDNHFGRYLDNFSNWVMYTTLVGLGEDKELWKLVSVADKHLIFNKNDFEHPERSKTFDILKSHNDKTLRTYATTVQNLLLYDVEQIPDFHPDKPVLYPPEPAQKKIAAGAGHGDRGGLFKPLDDSQLGDRGRLFDKPDTGGGGDRGNLYPDTNAPQKAVGASAHSTTTHNKSRYGSSVSPMQIGLGIGALVLVTGLGVGGYLWSQSQKTAVDPKVQQLLSGINSARVDDRVPARKSFVQISEDTTADPKLRSKAYTLNALNYVQSAITSGDNEQIKDVIKQFNKAIDLDGTNPDAYFGRGQMQLALKKKEEARSDFERAKSLDSKVAEYEEALKKLGK